MVNLSSSYNLARTHAAHAVVFVRAHPWQIGGAAAGVLLLAWLAFLQLTTAAPAVGGTFTEGTVGELTLVNPVLAQSEVDKQVSRLVFGRLEDITATSSVSFAGGRQLHRVTLREDARWHDDTPVTPEDILFTVTAIQDPQAASPLAPSWASVKAERTGENELTFSAPANYGYFAETRRALGPLPRHIYQPLRYSEWKEAAHALSPVGSGPYRYVETERKDDTMTEYRLEAVSERGDEHPDAPYISVFEWRFFPSTEELVKNFNRGKVDGMVLLDPDARESVHARHRTVPFDLQNYYAVFVNPSKNESLRDARVRTALQAALDKDELLAIVPGSSWFVERTGTSTPDPAALLREAGWRNESNQWVRTVEKTRTTELRVNLSVPDVLFLKRTADVIAAKWQALGIPTSVKVVGIDALTNDTIPNRTYEMLLFGNILSPRYDLFPFWHSRERFHPGLNLSLYDDPQTDSLVNAIRAATSDTERTQLFERTRTRLAADSAALFLYQTPYTYVVNSKAGGIKESGINESADRFNAVREWYIETERVWK